MTFLRSSRDLQAPVCRPLHIHLQLRIVRLEVAIIRRRARHEPYIRIACRQNPAFPEPGLIKRLLVRGVVRLVLRGRRGQACLLVCRNRGAQSFRSFSAEQMIAGREQSVILRIAVPAPLPSLPLALVGFAYRRSGTFSRVSRTSSRLSSLPAI